MLEMAIVTLIHSLVEAAQVSQRMDVAEGEDDRFNRSDQLDLPKRQLLTVRDKFIKIRHLITKLQAL